MTPSQQVPADPGSAAEVSHDLLDLVGAVLCM